MLAIFYHLEKSIVLRLMIEITIANSNITVKISMAVGWLKIIGFLDSNHDLKEIL